VDKNTYEFEAIGTHWWCELLDDASEITPNMKNEIKRICDEFDRRYSRFRDDSLVMELYRTGRLENPPHEMVKMLKFAHELYEISEGVFDIGIGAVLHRLGYGNRAHGAKSVVDIWQNISYSDQLVVAPMGVMLDFGGFGKGWLIDLITSYLKEQGVTQFIVNGGGDMYVATHESIEIALEDPGEPGVQWGQAMLMNEALAGSSTVKRAWEHEGARYHHIIDPGLQGPTVNEIKGTFVRAGTAKVADSLATILMIHPDLESALQKRYSAETIIVR
jgi:thiamine biosynthesis lipoprotein